MRCRNEDGLQQETSHALVFLPYAHTCCVVGESSRNTDNYSVQDDLSAIEAPLAIPFGPVPVSRQGQSKYGSVRTKSCRHNIQSRSTT